MNLNELNELDFQDMGNWPLPAKVMAIVLLCALILFAGYWFDTKDQQAQIDRLEQTERKLKQDFRVNASKAANLELYKQQMVDMQQSFGAMLKQLPSKTEVAELLVDISQTGLASGLEFELFQPTAEVPLEFYAELPIKLRVTGDYHEFGNFVSGVAALPRIVTLHDFVITPAKDGKLVMKATAKTYRYLDEEETQEAAK
ncbi:type 4a pilus biogenesis protein PilO [Sulfuriflexus sp.]|uniref:type 4a pilus biogenesis protein PilO n=1 Tax=Sulfuriflexus sp. TaxID=2015443 RepID=UPI0028CD9052|nr:type 4a pilus biogenesis protein PilO [Sulfuriflexus sp.]MDT8403149.1 type 4a pilus biogenesis protein PilO [Sulfuriflexus sp.]